MASVKQWAEWREEYLSGLRKIIDDAPYDYARLVAESECGYFDKQKAEQFVNEAIQKGLISTNDNDYFLKASSFAITQSAAESSGRTCSLEDALDIFKGIKQELEEDGPTEVLINLTTLGLAFPLIKACYYVFQNHPLACKTVVTEIINEIGKEIKWESLRLSKKELFEFLREMTPYGLNKLLTEVKCSANYFDDLFEAIQNGEYDEFKSLCREGGIDLTDIAEIAGYIMSVFSEVSDNTDDAFESSGNSVSDVQEFETFYMRPLFTMLGLPADDILEGFRSFNMGQELLNDLLPKMNSEEEAKQVSDLALVIVSLYPYIGHFDNDELDEIDRLLNNPFFEPISKAAQLLFAIWFKRFPNAVRLFFTQKEKDEIIRELLNAGAPNTSPEIPILPEGTNRPTISEEQSENEGLHWPTDEELKNYPNNYNDADYFTNTIFGPAGKVDIVGVEKLFAILVKQGVLKDDIETKLVFLARYSGKEIPGITLKPIEWDMMTGDREAAMGYLIYMTTTNHEFVKGERFFYFNFDGVKRVPNSRNIAQDGTRWANHSPKSKARTQFEIKLGKFLQEYKGEGEE